MRLGFSVGLVGVIAGVVAMRAGPGRAGTVSGRLELPPAPERGPVIARGFVDRIENPLAELKKPNLAPYLIVVLEGDPRPAAPAQVNWDLVGESFTRPVIAVPVGAEVVIKNTTRMPRTITAAEDHNLIVGPLNPTGTKSFRATQPAIYTIGDKDAPYLKGRIVVVSTAHVASVDDSGRFEIADVPDGSYKLKIYYYDPIAETHGKPSAWLDLVTDVTVVSKGKSNRTDVNVKVPAGDLSPSPRAAPGKK